MLLCRTLVFEVGARTEQRQISSTLIASTGHIAEQDPQPVQ